MGRRLKIEDLKDMGDGSFEKMQQQARESAGGDSEKAVKILTEMVLRDFLSFMRNKKDTANISQTEAGRKPNIRNLTWKPRKPRNFKTSVIDKENNKEWAGLVAISQAEKKTLKEKDMLEKDSREPCTKKRVCCRSDEEEKKTAKKPKTSKKETTEATPDLPDQFKRRIEEMNGTEPKLLIQKQVKKTDLEGHQRRFAIPRGELKTTEFLTREEHMIVDRIPDGDSIEVTLLDHVLQEFKVHLKRWKMGNSFTYNLTTGWLNYIRKNKEDQILRVDDRVQLWCFQSDSKSCLALVNLTHDNRRQ